MAKFFLFFLCAHFLQAKETLDHATISFYAVDCSSKKVLFTKNSHLSLIPASCLKIVTTASALHLLGKNFRFETHLSYSGSLNTDDHTLDGNIYIEGGGDPCLGSDRIAGALSWEGQIQAWVKAIKDLGIKSIQGAIIADTTKWEKAQAVPSWSWEDLGNYYGAGACALSFHENFYTLFLKPGLLEGEKTSFVRTEPPIDLTFYNEVQTGPKDSGDLACIYGSELSSTSCLRGTIPAGVIEFSIKGAIPDPASYVERLLTEALAKNGVFVQGEKKTYVNRKIFHTTNSPYLSQIIEQTNKHSLNLYAEHLVKKIGEVVLQEGSTKAGLKAITNFWRSKAIDLQGFHLADGSGLSRKNLVTTKQLVDILVFMKESSLFPVFLASLTQKDSLISAKTGSMSLIRGFAGYAGQTAFAILINQGLSPPLMKETIDLFVNELLSTNASTHQKAVPQYQIPLPELPPP